MTRNFKSIVAAVVTVAAAVTAYAGQGYSQYSTVGSQYNSSVTNFAVITDDSKNGGDPVLTYISATSDLSSSKLQFYNTTNFTPCVAGYTNINAYASSGTTTNVCVTSTNNFAPGDFLVIEHVPGDLFEMGVISTVNNTNQIVLCAPPVNTIKPGDMFFQEKAAGFIPVGAATLTVNGVGIYSGKRNKPLLMTLTGTSSDSINAASATYLP
jgi:hypothetical protein